MAMKPGVMRRKLRELVRPIGNPKVRVDDQSGHVVAIVRCNKCLSYGLNVEWSTNFVFVVDRWFEHMQMSHADELTFDWQVSTEPSADHLAHLEIQREMREQKLALRAELGDNYRVPDQLIRDLVQAGRLDKSWLDKIPN